MVRYVHLSNVNISETGYYLTWRVSWGNGDMLTAVSQSDCQQSLCDE